MSKSLMKFVFTIFILSASLISCKQNKSEENSTAIDSATATEQYSTTKALKESLTFYSSFDTSVDADFALGDARLYTVPNRQARDSARVGLHKPDIRREDGQGKFGAGLVFTERSPGYIYYPSEKNITYNTTNWAATVSFWLKLDPETDLEPGYCDPIQITDSGYNDAGIWVDFTKENPRDFRLGVIGDREVWNPNPEGPDNENPIFNARLIAVENPPFSSDSWTHIVIAFSGLNTPNGEASLYMNGQFKGSNPLPIAPFTWDYSLSNIYLGLSYIGQMDELSIYSRMLNAEEVAALYGLENGVSSILD
ncbi:LamG-like jellyroll fold domain-containing protein [Gilvibacter sp.]|uniref:LamG-like jellyroll fold domain-containing protein n=1 Tax=Gilvibacter sp. TaxID=2729997 RepID=UPI003F49F701